jgi:hypothetical protein
MKGVRLQHQGHLPWFGEIAVVKLLVGLGQKNLAPRVGVVPADGLQPVRILLRRRQQLRQSVLVSRGKRERRSERVLAIESHIIHDRHPPVQMSSQQNSADFSAAARQRKKRIHHRQADIVQRSEGILDREGAL